MKWKTHGEVSSLSLRLCSALEKAPCSIRCLKVLSSWVSKFCLSKFGHKVLLNSSWAQCPIRSHNDVNSPNGGFQANLLSNVNLESSKSAKSLSRPRLHAVCATGPLGIKGPRSASCIFARHVSDRQIYLKGFLQTYQPYRLRERNSRRNLEDS